MKQLFDIVVACDLNGGIGVGNQLPWRLPGDMKYFRKLTTGTSSQNTVIMGRNTWESIPQKFRPLPDRANIILSRNEEYPAAAGVSLCRTLDDALALAEHNNTEDCFVIGGANVYAQALLLPNCRRLYVTQVLAKFECDVFFPLYKERFQLTNQSELQEDNGIQYRYEVYERKA